MARGTLLFDQQEDGIGIAIDSNLDYFLSMSTLFSFSPKPSAGSTVIGGLAGLFCFMKRVSIHPSKHQNLA